MAIELIKVKFIINITFKIHKSKLGLFSLFALVHYRKHSFKYTTLLAGSNNAYSVIVQFNKIYEIFFNAIILLFYAKIETYLTYLARQREEHFKGI